VRENPFLGLKPYELEDRKKLYGRDKDLILMKDRIFSARTTLLFAGSGVGKTSFLNAKIRPEFEAQYCLIYHNQWSGTDEPLVALKETLTQQLPPGLQPHRETSNHADPLLNYLGGFKKSASTGQQATRCLLILDQFEEIFQYHAYEQYFAQFVKELSELINNADCNVRVLFSMREEFLGELSIFDNHIPDLFNNYYRLKCPNKLEAQEIIKRTCEVDSIAVDEDKLRNLVDEGKLKNLVDDLARVEKGETGTVERATSEPRQFIERDFIAPPYLQIACQRLWHSQFSDNTDTRPFLWNYEPGDARKMLNLFCQEKLSSLNDSEQRLLVDAFDFLVTKKGAKMAYELPSLAEHMVVNEQVLKSVLLKLSSPESRILRRSSGPDGVPWFELYHDMYAPIIDEWKRNYRLRKKAAVRAIVKRAAVAVSVVILVVMAYVAIHHWYIAPRWYRSLLSSADLRNPDKYPENESAFIKLNNTFGFGSNANKLWAEAWRRRARDAEREEKDTEAMLSWLQAATYSSSSQHSQDLWRIESYLNNIQYRTLLATFRTESPLRNASGSAASDFRDSDLNVPGPGMPLFSPDGKTLLTFTDDLRVLRWDTQTGELVKRSPPMQAPPYPTLEAPRGGQRNQNKTESDLTQRPQFQGTNGNLLAGFTGGGFFIWTIDNGAIFWSETGSNQRRNASPPSDISFSPDGQYLATIRAGRLATLYSLASDQKNQPKKIQTFESVNFLVFSPNSRVAVLQLKNRRVQLWDLEKGRTVVQQDFPEDYRVMFSPDSRRILLNSGTWTTPSKLIDASTLSTVRTLESVVNQGGTVSADGETFVYYAACELYNRGVILRRRGNILLLQYVKADTGERETVELIWDNASNAVFNPNRESMLTVSDDGSARLRSLALSPPVGRTITTSEKIFRFDHSDDHGTIAVLSKKGQISVWNAETGQRIRDLTPSALMPSEGPSWQYTFGLSPDGKYVDLSYHDNVLTVWEIATGREIQLLHPKNVTISSVIFSRDSRILVTEASDGVVRVWRDFQGPVSWKGQEDQRRSDATMSPDGKYLTFQVCSESPCPLHLLDLTKMEKVSLQDYDGSPVNFGGFSGVNTAIAAKDTQAFVWNLTDGRLLQRLTTSTPIVAIALNRDGTLAITACNDGTVQLWSTTDGHRIGSPLQFAKGFKSLEFSRDNTRVVGVSDRWLHLSSITSNGLQYDASRLIERFNNPSVLNDSSTQFRRYEYSFHNTITIEDIFMEFPPGVSAATLSPGQLLPQWQQKLDVRFDERGQIVSRKTLASYSGI